MPVSASAAAILNRDRSIRHNNSRPMRDVSGSHKDVEENIPKLNCVKVDKVSK